MKNYLWIVLSLAWSGVIVYLSFMSPVSTDSIPLFEHQDKLGHFIFYAVLSLLFIKTFSQIIITMSPITLGATIAFVFGGLIELGQHFFTLDRYGSIMDVFANGMGALLMAIFINNYPKLFQLSPKI
jgi:VanZ family protein